MISLQIANDNVSHGPHRSFVANSIYERVIELRERQTGTANNFRNATGEIITCVVM
jgi:hypothetical protein